MYVSFIQVPRTLGQVVKNALQPQDDLSRGYFTTATATDCIQNLRLVLTFKT